jgi:MoaA/NifB/PqqE/SkfB family radical SAM enzyme
VLNKIQKIIFCGNFGDPLVNQDFKKMCEHIKPLDIYTDIHTNGSLQSLDWWKKLPNFLSKQHRVVFALDGLADTHSVYRVGTSFEKIIKNARGFIDNGGNAEWSFIVFKHNAHQIEEAKELSKQIGFNKFTVKNSSRFAFQNKFSVLDTNGNLAYYLEPAKNETTVDLSKIEQIISQSNISCYAQHQDEVYIDAYKNLMPCCFLASLPYNYYKKDDVIATERTIAHKQYIELIKELGNTNTLERSVKEIVDSTQYQTIWKKYWTVKKLYVCARTCGDKIFNPSQQILNST